MPLDARPSLSQRLYADRVDAQELQALVLSFYSRGKHLDGRLIGYGREENSIAIIIQFTKAGSIASIKPGPDYIDAEVETLAKFIKEQLIDESDTAVGRRIMFAGTPFRGSYRYRDRFQILPVPPEAPRPVFGTGGHPFQIEVAFRDASDWSVKSRRMMQAAHEIELLCSALLGPVVLPALNQFNCHWVMTSFESEPTYSYSQGGYGWPGMKGPYDSAFSSLDGFPPAKWEDAQTYYTENSIGAGEALALPSTFNQSLDTYFALSQDDRKRFLAACYWYQQYGRLWAISRSAAFVALVSAVEALTIQSDSVTCDHCHSKISAGPTQLFAAFIEKFVPNASATSASRKALYRLRSQITHGDKILLSDRAEWIGGFVSTQEQMEIYRLHGIVRIAIINWLLSQSEAAPS